jgi:ribonucleotide reductase alpha subunit
MINQITMPTNIGIPIRKIPRLPLGQRVTTRYTIGVIMVGLMTLKIKRFFKKMINQMLHPNSPKMFNQI